MAAGGSRAAPCRWISPFLPGRCPRRSARRAAGADTPGPSEPLATQNGGRGWEGREEGGRTRSSVSDGSGEGNPCGRAAAGVAVSDLSREEKVTHRWRGPLSARGARGGAGPHPRCQGGSPEQGPGRPAGLACGSPRRARGISRRRRGSAGLGPEGRGCMRSNAPRWEGDEEKRLPGAFLHRTATASGPGQPGNAERGRAAPRRGGGAAGGGGGRAAGGGGRIRQEGRGRALGRRRCGPPESGGAGGGAAGRDDRGGGPAQPSPTQPGSAQRRLRRNAPPLPPPRSSASWAGTGREERSGAQRSAAPGLCPEPRPGAGPAQAETRRLRG